MSGSSPKDIGKFVLDGPWDEFVSQSNPVIVSGSLSEYFPMSDASSGKYVVVSLTNKYYHFRDYLDIYGTFDPGTNTIVPKTIKVLQHRSD